MQRPQKVRIGPPALWKPKARCQSRRGLAPIRFPGRWIAELILMSGEWTHLEERPGDGGQHPEDEEERQECADHLYVHGSPADLEAKLRKVWGE